MSSSYGNAIQKGAVVHGFEFLEEREISELETRGSLFRHAKTGAELLSLENNDENKVFGICFRTPPADASGAAHILEHCVLCGSRKYPVKDPFQELLRSSPNSYLNALTYPDRTCYPVASQNLQDFYNLVDVYLDAVFYPRLDPRVFRQEGWRYELDENVLGVPIPGSQDGYSRLLYQGVVFNEMKGTYASPDQVLAQHILQSLFPDTAYRLDAGGDPAHIPDLNHEQFRAFHREYYHPSNAKVFFWGDDDPRERLRLVDDYFQSYGEAAIEATVGLQVPFDRARRVTQLYAAGQGEGVGPKGIVTVNWVLAENGDPVEILSWEILNAILLGAPASPLRKTLLESGLGEDLAGDGVGLDLRQMTFSTGLKGIAVENLGKVEALVLDTLTDLTSKGIPSETVEAALNSIEFRLRERNSGSLPRGLLYMLDALNSWTYDKDPLSLLAFETPLKIVKQRLDAGPYFEGMISRHLLDNSHRSILHMQADSGLGRRLEIQETEKLAKLRSDMNRAEVEAVRTEAQDLRVMQETPDSPQALATIPRLKLSDLNKQNKTTPSVVTERAGTPVMYHNLATNGVFYLDLGFNLHMLPQVHLPYVPLFGRVLLEMGTDREDYVSLSHRIGRKTGGIWPALFSSVARGTEATEAWLFLRGKSVVSQSSELLGILRDVLLSVRLDDRDRLRQMVLEEKSGLEAGLAALGTQLAQARLWAHFNEAYWAYEQMSGISQLFFLRHLVDRIDTDWPGVLSTFQEIQHLLVNRNAMLCNVTLDEESWRHTAPQMDVFLSALPSTSASRSKWHPHVLNDGEGLVINAPVNFVGKGADLYQLGYRLHGSAFVIANYLSGTWLWDRVRSQGGAYDSACDFDDNSGLFTFLSYRDPNLLGTIENYDLASTFLRQGNLTHDDLVKSIIGTIGDMDAYQLPDAKGYSAMLRLLLGKTDEMRQQMRAEILGTTAADIVAFADVLDQVRDRGKVAVLGSQQSLEAANAARPRWLQLIKVE